MKLQNIIMMMAAAGVMMQSASCEENKYGVVDLTLPDSLPGHSYQQISTTYTYAHPTTLYAPSDFDRVKAELSSGTAPAAVSQAFENLRKSAYTQLPYTPSPTEEIVRGDAKGTKSGSENYAHAMRDAAAAYQQALLWRITGDDSYAASAANILNQWTNVCKVVTSNDANHVLAAGAQGYTFAMAAEMLSGYSGWSESQRATTRNWLIDVFASVNRDFLDYHAHTADGAEHYWSNWDLVTLCSYMAIGIFAENNDMVNFVVNYFYSGAGNGCIYKLTRGTHTDPLGTGEILCQNQESGRDQGHAQMSMAVAAQLCQMAYSLYQSNKSVSQLDFFSADNNAILHMAEYVALGNLRDGTDNKNASGAWLINAARMPFTEYVYAKGYSWGAVHTQMTDDEGRGNPRPGWEIICQHYRHSGSGFVYSQKFADKLRPEGGAGEPANRYGSNSGAFDQLGWNTLMLYQE